MTNNKEKKPYYDKKGITIYNADCLEKLKELKNKSVDAIVTDPPYGLGFMGKEWDELPPGKEVFEECLRILKPGGHLLSFGGTRTYHRMAVAIEDAGFEIRDMLEWIYASGFPKSHNVGKAYDKKMGNEREVTGTQKLGGTAATLKGKANRKDWYDQGAGGTYTPEINITKGNSQWEGFGTNLKPAHEPLCLARKPLSEKTIVENCIKHGTGALDIDGCRIPTQGEKPSSWFDKKSRKNVSQNIYGGGKGLGNDFDSDPTQGRFPSNLLVTDDALNDGKMTKGKASIRKNRSGMGIHDSEKGTFGKGDVFGGYDDSGSKSRYFDIDVWAEKHGLIQCPKASKRERNKGCEGLEKKKQDPTRKEGNPGGDNPRNRGLKKRKNHHPTVKPLHLMSWLVRLISKRDDTVLDPFMGSGTTGIACKKLGRNFIGIEKEKEYCKIAEARLKAVQPKLI